MVDSGPQIKYCISDVWLLASIEFSGGKEGATIRDIIGAGDYINHAIFTEKEFEEGLCRLTEGGWIREIGGRFSVSKKFKEQKISYSSPKGRHSTKKLRVGIRELLDVNRGCKYGSKSNKLKYPGFTSKKFTNAIKEYKNSF